MEFVHAGFPHEGNQTVVPTEELCVRGARMGTTDHPSEPWRVRLAKARWEFDTSDVIGYLAVIRLESGLSGRDLLSCNTAGVQDAEYSR
jgi:hypothetical protein